MMATSNPDLPGPGLEREDSRAPEGVAAGGEAPGPPPVTPPSAAFLVQLFAVPLVIVAIIVGLWWGIGWLAGGHADPHELAKRLAEDSSVRWQAAHTLAALLSDPRNGALRRDPRFCQTLCQQLEKLSREEPAGQTDRELRVFLCRAVGQLERREAAELLARIARPSSGQPPSVRLAAVEGLAQHARRQGADSAETLAAMEEALLAVSRESTGEARSRQALQAAAAYALGTLSTPRAQRRLRELLVAGYPDTRYNAATGLAWRGDRAALPVLLEMLDPNNPFLLAGEPDAIRAGKNPASQEAVLAQRRALVIGTAIRAAVKLEASLPPADQSRLEKALQDVAQDKRLPRTLRLDARQALRAFATPGRS